MSQGYQETIILECSRQSSAEGIANNDVNPAEFTNEMGSGIILNIGDEISVHSAYISELGAQAGEIEIKKRNTLVPASSIVTTYSRIDRDETISTKYSYETSVNAPITIESKYEEMPIVVSPYKTSNGENYITLPRNGLSENSGAGAAAVELTDWNVWDYQGGLLGTSIGAVWGKLNKYQYVTDDYKWTAMNGSDTAILAPAPYVKGMIKNDNSRYTIFRLNETFFNSSAAELYGTNGSVSGLSPLTTFVAATDGYFDARDKRDVAIIGSWSQVRDLITLKAKDGFNSPADVATDLTLQMNQLGPKITKVFPTTTAWDAALNRDGRIFTEYRETPSYKTYNCATPDKITIPNFYTFRDVASTVTPAEVNTAHYYMSAYQHIGVKRPNFFKLGRELNASQGFLIPPDVGGPGNIPTGGQCLCLAIPWSDANIDQFTAFFNEQNKHPEFWTDMKQQDISGALHDISEKQTSTRFLHWNMFDDRSVPLGAAPNHKMHVPRDTLGYDLYGSPTFPVNWVYNASQCTLPIFFDYNPDKLNVKAADVGWTDVAGGGLADYDDLAYGWARKMRTGDGQYWIGVQFSQITDPAVSSLPLNLFGNDTHIAKFNGSGRRFGYDYHFTAYGNAAMMLYNGDINSNGQDFGDNGTSAKAYWNNSFSLNDFGTADHLQSTRKTEIFLGADAPAFEYDENSQRFNILNLHTPERQGNSAAAGNIPASNASTEATAVYYPVNPNANASTYKINKRNLANNFTPNMTPYHLGVNGSATLQYPAETMFSNNYEPWTIYDANGGIFIEDFIIPQFEWNPNLAGVMGFRYNQFHRDNGRGRQTRVDNYLDASKMDQPTTNALVNAGDFIGYTKNGFNNSDFNITTGYSLTPNRGGRTIPAGLAPINNYPAIDVLGISSTAITAQDLPTKSLRPYYAIRSDIIPRSQFLGGNGDLRSGPYLRRNGNAVGRPVIGIVDKVNGYADFYTAESSQLTFTNTEKRVITQIKTSIHDPDGSFADVDLNTSIIYKINRQLNVDLTPLDTLLESKKKKDKELALQAEQMLIDPQDEKQNYSSLFK